MSIYLPDALAADARQAGLNVSALAQEAIRRALAADETNRWLDVVMGDGATGVTHDDVIEALDATRDEPATRHG